MQLELQNPKPRLPSQPAAQNLKIERRRGPCRMPNVDLDRTDILTDLPCQLMETVAAKAELDDDQMAEIRIKVRSTREADQ